MAALAAAVVLFPPPASAAAGTAGAGPPLETPVPELAAAVRCSPDLQDAATTPVLLVPGTAEASEHVYSWGYQKALREEGRPVCVLDALPGQGVGDIQTTAEYAVHAIRHMNDIAGRKVSVIGHSQGGLLAAWALRFWPDLPARVDDVVSLASPYRGSGFADVTCAAGVCPAFAWQFRPSAAWVGALTREPFPEGPELTSIGSRTDELIWPAPAATAYPGEVNVMVQEVCPLRAPGHMTLLADATAYALAQDALANPGAADPDRVGSSSCGEVVFDAVDVAGMTRLLGLAGGLAEAVLTAPYTTAEPPLRAYARE
ncbi:lipase family alpha/beta hydrolase [Streptomyces sp. MAR4 CNX-425]|uniref:lipase family alpha/beta hydrolase n=1 Tax=Streptomyces sp. MAR4 CNX-425 TaxID=3406343 RepID=UPI003B504490